MAAWPKAPVVFEINTWVWLGELSRRHKRSVTLADVPDQEWDAIAAHGFDAVWLMGVWERSAEGIAISQQNEGLLADFRRALPDFKAQDNCGSPYCVRRYAVDERLGGPAGLKAARAQLAKRGLKLILDFVPNHLAPDAPWAREHPEYFIQGSEEDLAREPAAFIRVGKHVLACGRDPYFPAWPDVIQVNAFEPGLRNSAVRALSSIAEQADGVRCDMAMLMMNSVFERTWGGRAGQRPPADYWPQVIGAVNRAHPEFLFMAEAYWDLEWELMQQGFDFCYDKKLYDRMEHDGAQSVRGHLCAEMAYQSRLVRFLENHDEPRAAATFPVEKGRAAAVAIATLPGMAFFHEGQFEGRKVRLPVFLGRRPEEPADKHLAAFYRKLLKAVHEEKLRVGEWRLCETSGWEGNSGFPNLIAWCWKRAKSRHVVVVNFSDTPAQGRIHFPWDDLWIRNWRLNDLLSGATYDRVGNEMQEAGLYCDLPAWGFHLLRFS